MIEDKKGRGTLSSPDNVDEILCEVAYHIHREHETPPSGPGVYVVEIKWIDVGRPRLAPGVYVLTEEDGKTRHLVEQYRDGGWSLGRLNWLIPT